MSEQAQDLSAAALGVIPPPASWTNCRVAVWGAGSHGGGLAIAQALQRRGAHVALVDRQTPQELFDTAAVAGAAGWPWHIAAPWHPVLGRADIIVPSPAIPPAALAALPDNHPPLVSPESIALHEHTGPRIMCTGTKGKSTTAAAIATLLDWTLAGNSNQPLIAAIDQHGPSTPLVIEASSFQLWYLAASKPHWDRAVLTILDADHIAWHGSLTAYQQAKRDGLSWATRALVPDTLQLPPGTAPIPRVHIADGHFRSHTGEPLAPLAASRLIGGHQQENLAAALAVAIDQGLDPGIAEIRLSTVTPLPHRLETITTKPDDPFTWINDSTATTPVAAMAALDAIDGPLAIIVGGADKGSDLGPLTDAIRQRNALAICLGATGPNIAGRLARHDIDAPLAADMQEAVDIATSCLPNGGTILLAPGCASTDQFADFAARGAAFAQLAQTYQRPASTVNQP